MEQLLKRINELAAIAKKRELSKEEYEEREKLRKKYIKLFRQGLEQQLSSIKFINEE